MSLSCCPYCCPQAGGSSAPRGAGSADPPGADLAEQVRHLYLCQGLSTYRIAAIAGISRQRIGRMLQQAGVAVKPRGAGRPRPLGAELAALAETMDYLYVRHRHRHPPGPSAVTAPSPVTGHAAGSQQAAAGTFTWALAAALAATALAAIAFARPRALDGGRARAASRVPRCQWAGGAGALASVGGVTALRVLDRMSMLDRVAVRARLAENLLEQVTDAIVGQLVADDPAVPAAGHGAARPEQPQRLGHGGVVQPGGDRQVRDADRAGPVDAQQQREPGRVGQDLESLRPGPDVLAVPDRADGRADELAVEDAAAEIRRYEMHALIMPAGGNYSLPSA